MPLSTQCHADTRSGTYPLGWFGEAKKNAPDFSSAFWITVLNTNSIEDKNG
jgi:hypothetical protein